MVEELQKQLNAQSVVLDEETIRENKWKEENARRKHNYVPFIIKMLEILAARNKLIPLLEEAKQRKSKKDTQNQT